MPRSNRSRRGGRSSGRAQGAGRRGARPWHGSADRGDGDDDRDDLAHLLDGMRRTEQRGGVAWTVQPISAARAQKPYSCPGCGRGIQPGVAHVAVWRADFVLGDAHALDGRRHWHTHCWRVA